MASFGDRINVIIDVTTNKALSGLKDFRNAVSEAEGFTGKFKAGVGSLKGTFGGVLGSTASLAAGITAIGVGAIKSANQFSELAKRAIDLAKATGLSTTEASKWIAVADDFGIQAESLQTGLARIGKTLDAAAWDKYGIQTRDASGAAKSANDIFLQALDVLGKVGNQTERARIGNELFGKGYAGIAPIVGNTRAEYEKMLATVTAGETVTSGEARRAETWRLAQDKLSDATANLGNAFGNLVVAASPLLDVIGGVLQKVADLVDIAGEADISKPLTDFGKVAGKTEANTADLVNAFVDLAHESGNARSRLDKTGAVLKEMFSIGPTGAGARFDNYKKAIRELAETAPEQAGKVITALTQLVLAAEKTGNTDLKKMGFTFDSVNELAGIAVDAAGGMDALGWSIEKVGDATTGTNDDLGQTSDKLGRFRTSADNARNALKQLQDQISGRLDFVRLQQQLANNAKTIKQVEQDFHDNKISAEEYYNGVAEAALDSKSAVADYVAQVDAIPQDKKLELVAKLDPASPRALVNDIQRTLDTSQFYANVVGRLTVNPTTKKLMEGGIPADTTTPATNTTGTGSTTSGKKDNPPRTVNSQANSIGFSRVEPIPVNITVNVPPGANLVDIGRVTADALAAFYRAGGERP